MARPYITILQACKEAKLMIQPTDRKIIGRAWFNLYKNRRKKDKQRYPWVGKVYENKVKVRAYGRAHKQELIQFIKMSLQFRAK